MPFPPLTSDPTSPGDLARTSTAADREAAAGAVERERALRADLAQRRRAWDIALLVGLIAAAVYLRRSSPGSPLQIAATAAAAYQLAALATRRSWRRPPAYVFPVLPSASDIIHGVLPE